MHTHALQAASHDGPVVRAPDCVKSIVVGIFPSPPHTVDTNNAIYIFLFDWLMHHQRSFYALHQHNIIIVSRFLLLVPRPHASRGLKTMADAALEEAMTVS